jgi:hypothetical protein
MLQWVMVKSGTTVKTAVREFANPIADMTAFNTIVQSVGITLIFIGATALFMPLFVFLPKVIQWAMKAKTHAILDAFGKNKQVRKVFRTVFIVKQGS